MSGQFNNNHAVNNSYWLITPISVYIRVITTFGNAQLYLEPSEKNYIKPAFNLKSNVVITSGKGTKSEPFELSLKQ